MAIAELLAERLWPKQDCRFSAFQFALGNVSSEPEIGFGGALEADSGAAAVDADTLFDLASVTKLYTAALAAKLHAAGELDLSAPISDWGEVPAALGSLSSLELLTHTAGLPPEWEETEDREGTIRSLTSLEPNAQRRGSIVYSCTGYSLFSVMLEQKFAAGFDQLIREQLLVPLGLDSTMFNPHAASQNIASAQSPGEGIEFGVVHDPRSRAMAGVSGNAGLFANASDVFAFFAEVATGASGVIGAEARSLLFTPLISGEWQQCVGFRFQDSARVGAGNSLLSHTGFTGTLVALDQASGNLGVMLTNRLSCGASKEQMAKIYRAFAGKVAS